MSRDIPLDLIDRDPEQPRRHFDPVKLGELAQTLQAHGLIQPILLRPAGGRYFIVHGERRYRAALLLGWATIAAEIRDLSPEEARLLSLIENVQRSDLSPIEEARAYEAQLAGGMTQAALGERIGKSQSYIATKLRFLSLSGKVQQKLDEGHISEGHAKQLLRLQGPEEADRLCDRIVAERWTVRQANMKVDAARLLEPHSKAKLSEAVAWLKGGEAEGWDQGGFMAEEFCRLAFLVGDILNRFEYWGKKRGRAWLGQYAAETLSLGDIRALMAYEDELEAHGLELFDAARLAQVPASTLRAWLAEDRAQGVEADEWRYLARAGEYVKGEETR